MMASCARTTRSEYLCTHGATKRECRAAGWKLESPWNDLGASRLYNKLKKSLAAACPLSSPDEEPLAPPSHEKADLVCAKGSRRQQLKAQRGQHLRAAGQCSKGPPPEVTMLACEELGTGSRSEVSAQRRP